MRRSFKCQPHVTHVLQNKDSLFVKCFALLSESLTTTHRAPRPVCSGTVSGSLPGPWLVVEKPLPKAGPSQQFTERAGGGDLPTRRGAAGPRHHLLLFFPQVWHLALSFCARLRARTQPAPHRGVTGSSTLPSCRLAGRSRTQPGTADVRVFQESH